MIDITPIRPKITAAGLAAAFNAQNTGLAANITHVAFGDGDGSSYTPTGAETELANELGRAPVGGGEKDGPSQVLLQGALGDGAEFWIREVGFILEDGTLFALWSEIQENGDDTLMAFKKEGRRAAPLSGPTASSSPRSPTTPSTSWSVALR